MPKTLAHGLTETSMAAAFTPVVAELRQENQFWFQTFLKSKIQKSRFFKILKTQSQNPAATVINYDSKTPKGVRGSYQKGIGELFPMGISFDVDAQTLIDLKTADEYLLKLYDDVKSGILSLQQRLEFAFLQGISTGESDLTADNNAGGVIHKFVYPIPDAQKVGVSTIWSTSGSAKPLTDIREAVRYIKLKMRVIPAFILMEYSTISKLLNADDTKIVILNQTIGKIQSKVVSLKGLNEYLKGEDLPQIIEINDNIQYIKADGSIDETKRAWNADKITFIPAGILGRIAYIEAPEKNIKGLPYLYSEQSIFSIIQEMKTSPPVLTQEMKLYGYPVMDRIFDLFFMNTNSTNW